MGGVARRSIEEPLEGGLQLFERVPQLQGLEFAIGDRQHFVDAFPCEVAKSGVKSAQIELIPVSRLRLNAQMSVDRSPGLRVVGIVGEQEIRRLESSV